MAMSRRRQALLALGFVIIVAGVAIWIGSRRQPWPSPPSDLEVAATWLQCMDCEGSFLQRLDEMPASNADTVTRFLRSALLNGPDSLRLRRLERDLRRTWDRDSLRRAKRGDPARPVSQRVAFLERYRQGFNVRLRSRAAIGLGVIGNPLARATLDSALKIPPVTRADSAVYRVVKLAADSADVAVATARPQDADTLPFGDVAGTVVNDAGRPISGANLVVEGTSIATTTRPDGQYRLTHIPAGTRALRAQMIGHRPQRVSITVTGGGHMSQDFRLQRLPDSLAVVTP
jgi:hypothetical protein